MIFETDNSPVAWSLIKFEKNNNYRIDIIDKGCCSYPFDYFLQKKSR